MKKILSALAATAFLASAAYAAEVQGTVQSVDPATRTITLEDGTSYTADQAVDLSTVVAGDKVMITVDDTTTSAVEINKAE
ncbi:DUF1344 domain-containing protein [Nitratireductor mangrovi]|uniref:DUF1344 domain-containing protein n=1 Tax=Nitratireductor mangrovi TaxID=2599600 RepID=A0A5B8L1Y3_9HYPH|nr:DUF1344 domain-containing protein [Nitratireductor mangrovi]QDZ02014.1 DUF1344 domain-containing protein [Nitratireductor mangrovi]